MVRIKFNFLIVILGILLSLVFLLGIYKYDESKLIYTFFSLIFFILLFTGLYKTITYSYSFLAIFLFLGFWSKLTIHLLFDYSYVEPIGHFYKSNASMDDVLILSSVGGIAVLLVYFLFKLFKLNGTIKIIENKRLYRKEQIYYFYKKYKSIILVCLLFVLLVLSILNIIFNIQMTGVVPTTILIFPLNALVYWLFAIGFILIYSYLFYLEIQFEKKLNTEMIVLFLLVSALCSISIISRGIFIFLFASLLSFIFFNYEYFINYKLSDFF